MRKLLYSVGFIAPLGGLLFGYNTAVISSALLFLKNTFLLTTLQQEFLVSIILIGALIGAGFAGSLSDRFGRKPVILISDVFFIVGGISLISANHFLMLLLGRFITGIGVGISSLTVPLYISELSPPKKRGALVTLNQLAITVGILLAYLVGLFEADAGNWKAMFGYALLPAVVQLIGMVFLPESPVYLAMNGKIEAAKKLFKKIRARENTERIISKLKVKEKKAALSSLFQRAMVPALIVGLGLSILQQITGINTVIYYANQIFGLAGFGTAKAAIWASLGLGIVNVITTVISVWLLDRAGRRPLLIFGLLGMTVGLLALSLTFWLEIPAESYLSVISLMVYIASFAIGLGPVAWLIISEIYPHSIRGRAMSLAIFSNWGANYLVSLSFLTLVEWLTSSGAFLLYAIICAYALFFVWKRVPETKGKTLEEIEGFWKKGKKA
ncbi:MAG: sugar porter family MFS transporter [Chlamydiia bacterium]|nr:sugar porter family MFS transporter [Chlamydiia bacterium]MCP5509788.1 sugar porter family MFS transporter [Chlamydiales bacterium]